MTKNNFFTGIKKIFSSNQVINLEDAVETKEAGSILVKDKEGFIAVEHGAETVDQLV
ncbi:MAG: hypothetical protein Q9M20_04700 [Mariprofundaceae bacterium]|nr:hypothetical protein [Mariprofundaceae bacterium]